MKRLAAGVATFALAPLIGAAAAAAAPTASRLTSPGDPVHVLWQNGSPAQVAFTATGTTTGGGNVDLNCYAASGVTNIATNQTASTLAAGIQVRANQLGSAPCVLRAVPTGDGSAHPPGTPDPFAGPRIFESTTSETLSGGAPESYTVQSLNLRGLIQIGPEGACSIGASRAVDPTTLAESESLFPCDAALERLATRPAVRIDGAGAYSAADSAPGTPGWRPLSLSVSHDPSSGDVTIDETDPYVSCQPSPMAYPPSGGGCSSLSDTGVALHRTWVVDDQDRAAHETDAWSATDGRRHSLDALYEQRLSSVSSGSPPFASFDFPGTGGFAAYANGATVSVPRGTGSVMMKQDGATPDGGDGQHPQGALTWASAPDGPATFVASDESGGTPDFLLPYERTVPASGTTTLRFTFAQAFSLADALAIAEAAAAAYLPSITISSPANGSTTGSGSALVIGSAADSLGVAQVTVNGDRVFAASDGSASDGSASDGSASDGSASDGSASDGSWSAPINLSPGANTVTAAVTNLDGTTVQRQITVSYVPGLFLQGVAAPRATRNGVEVTLRCSGPSGSCNGVARLLTTERIRGRTLVGVARTRRRTVTVGSKKFSIPVGRTVRLTVTLNATGRRLLRRFGQLPVRLSIRWLSPDGTAHTIRSGTLTLKPQRRHRSR